MYFKISLILVLLLIVTGCQNNPSESGEMSDEQLMQGIIDAEKTDISMEQLPSQSRTVIIDDYYDYKEIDAKMASDMGYQVSMDSKGYKPGDHNEVYFNIKGRELKPNRDDEDKNGFKCFELVLPVTFIMPDGLSITVEDENGYMGVRNWYENNPDSKEKPTLKYSMDGVDIIYQDGTTKTIYTETEMHKYYRSCSYKDDNKKSWVCFRLVYPITYIMPDDETTISMDHEKDWMGIKGWYENNQESDERPALEYPVDIFYKDGTTQTISDDEEMHEYYRSCSNKDDDKKDRVCFRLVYPITYIMSDGSNILMEDKKDWTELKGWHGNNPKSDGRPVLEYPVDIIYQDGTTQTIINIEEMKNAKENCRD